MAVLKTLGRWVFPLLATVILFIFPDSAGLAWADAATDRVTQLIRPGSTVNFGAGYLSSDGARFGQYSGVRDEGAYGLLNADILNRNDATGIWFKFMGRNLGLDNRELRLEHSRQGSWGYFIDFSQTPRYEPFTVNTAVSGIGTPNLTVPTASTAGSPALFKTERTAVGFGLNKLFAGNLDLQLHFRNEDKDGARLFGRGTRSTSAGAFEFTPEPINFTSRQFGATLGYNGKQLQLSGGYYGTLYVNHNTALNITGGSSIGGGNALNTYTPITLPPDNQSHQLFFTGGYSLTPTTRGTFKAAYTNATQNNAFIDSMLLAPGAGSSLRGRIDTTLLQAGITARPLSKLSLLSNIRYEDRDDKTPVLNYNPLAPGYPGINQPFSMRTLNAKLEANYALPMSFRLTSGVDFDQRHRDYGTSIVVRHRNRTDELSYRIELRRSMSETITGALSYIHSDRSGSNFLNTVTPGYTNLVTPINLADRSRNKIRLLINWVPVEPLSLQFIMDESRDNYEHHDLAGLGPQKGMARDYSLDATYAFSDAWQATVWFSRNETRADQFSRTNPVTAGGQPWAAKLSNLGTSVGVGINGRPSSRMEVGADLNYSTITDKYRQRALSGPAIASLPNISTELSNLRLFVRYAVLKNMGLRLDYIYNRFKTDEWTWASWTYTDGTRLSQNPNQVISFIGLSGYYNW